MSGTRLVPFRPDEGPSETTKCLQAADGIRTHDLLHGKQPRSVAPASNSRVVQGIRGLNRTARVASVGACRVLGCTSLEPPTTIEQGGLT
jgi:hypothetical protein